MNEIAKKQLLIETVNLTKYFELKKGLIPDHGLTVRAVDGVDLKIYQGETLGLVGESGCGKTTFGQLVLRLENTSDGRIIYKGKDIHSFNNKQMHDFRKKVQIVFQDPFSSLNPGLTVGSILHEPYAIHRVGTHKQRREWIRSLLESVDLPAESISRFPHEFSGGQRQRICIARALALNPELIICDEATSALDVSIQAQIINLLLRLQQENKFSYLFISHNLNVVEHICDRIAVMYLGRIVELGPVEVYSISNTHPYTTALLSANPSIDPRKKKAKTPLTGEIPSPIYPPKGCHFHPRCPQRIDVCDQEVPELTEVVPGHSIRCFLYQRAVP